MKTISCYEAVKRIFELLEGELTRTKKEELDGHISTCRDCCNRFEFEELLKKKLQKASGQEKTPKRLVKRIDSLLKSF
ncbi:zf-HC2 domain-containing protein [Candidatus Gottesmanbacteria bacterium]|nr:zf-HC2 domain-containing protein [Candidatus Gottesmanbacteria bacterium]